MNKSAVLKKYKQIGKDLEGQRSVLKKEVNELAKKNIEQTKSDDESFYSNKQKSLENIDRIKNALVEKKRLLEESNINKDDVFLFSNAPQKETYNLQLQILRSVSSGLKTAQAVKERAEGEETFAKNRRKKINEFYFFVKIKDVKKIKNLSKILEDIFKLDLDYYVKYDNIPIENIKAGKDDLMSFNRKYLIKIQEIPKDKEMVGYASFLRNTRYTYCQKLSEIFNKYGIENFIISEKVMEKIDANKVVDSNLTQCSKIENEAKKSIEKEYKAKKIIRNLLLFLAIAVIVVCVPGMDGIEKMIENSESLKPYYDIIMTAIYPVLLGTLVFTITFRCMVNTEKKNELEKCQKYCDGLFGEYFKKYYKLLVKLSNEYYAVCKTDYFEKSEQMIKEMLQFKAFLVEESENIKLLLSACFKNSMPNGLIENELLLDTIVKVMEEGRASEYKEARTIAEGLIEKEQIMRQQTEYLVDKARKDDEHRKAVMNSQLRMEKHAEEQAEAARRSAEAASRAAEAQEKAAAYAKNTAESSQKLLDLEEKKRWEEISKG